MYYAVLADRTNGPADYFYRMAQKLNYCILSISLLNIDQFLQLCYQQTL